MVKDIKILVFGNSDTYGAWDFEGGWVERLRKIITKKVIETNHKFYCILYNLSISGNTTKNILERFEAETMQRINESEKVIILFQIGTNDTIHDRKDIAWTEPDRFRENLKQLIALARKYSSNILFISPTAVDEEKTNPVSWDIDVYYNNSRLEKYSEIIKSVCKSMNVEFIDVFDKFKQSEYKKLLKMVCIRIQTGIK